MRSTEARLNESPLDASEGSACNRNGEHSWFPTMRSLANALPESCGATVRRNDSHSTSDR